MKNRKSNFLIFCHCRILVRRYRPLGLNMYVAKENTIYKDVLHRLCKTAPAGTSEEECTTVPTNFKPVLIVIPCRPGINTIEESYIPVLKSFLSSPLSLGIIGGKPNLSLYFIGFQSTVFSLQIFVPCSHCLFNDRG